LLRSLQHPLSIFDSWQQLRRGRPRKLRCETFNSPVAIVRAGMRNIQLTCSHRPRGNVKHSTDLYLANLSQPSQGSQLKQPFGEPRSSQSPPTLGYPSLWTIPHLLGRPSFWAVLFSGLSPLFWAIPSFWAVPFTNTLVVCPDSISSNP
jgi:hypothetical protein